jgi:hypothetical protein
MLNRSRSKQTLAGLLTLWTLSSIDFASRKQNQSWRQPRKAAWDILFATQTL